MVPMIPNLTVNPQFFLFIILLWCHFRDEKIKKKIIRIFKIWEERGIYDAKLIMHITDLIENAGTVNATENDTLISGFQVSNY